jgi:hypothetical protein
MCPVCIRHLLSVIKSLYQQHDHRSGLTSTWAADNDKSAVLQTGIHLVVQPGYYTRVE